jgi:hypothetical protein
MTRSALLEAQRGYFPAGLRRPSSSVMESQLSPAEVLPALYRAILDRVAQLEQLGERREAALVRTEATRIYSASWDEAGRRRLTALIRRVDRVIAGEERPRAERARGWSAIGRYVPAR